jgi:hypothetical protein
MDRRAGDRALARSGLTGGDAALAFVKSTEVMASIVRIQERSVRRSDVGDEVLATSRFGAGRIDAVGIGFELRLTKATERDGGPSVEG